MKTLCRSQLVASLVGIALLLIQPGNAAEPPPLDKPLIDETVEVVGATIRKEYFDADVANRVADSLQQWKREGRYASESSFDSLATKLTADLFELTKDRHLAVAVVRTVAAPNHPAQSADHQRQKVGQRTNFGVQRVEVLSGNVGYLNLTAFYRLDEARDVIEAAMQTLKHTDALILDLRENGGGSPETVARLASYFFDEKGLPLFEIVPRSGEPRAYTTVLEELCARNAKRALYVLTSSRTFSAGEGMAFLLQERERAEIIGETTAGAANPGRPYPAGAHFEVTVPNGKVVSCIKQTNWENQGVTPDVQVAAADALRVAHLSALQQLVKDAEPGEWRDELERRIQEFRE